MVVCIMFCSLFIETGQLQCSGKKYIQDTTPNGVPWPAIAHRRGDTREPNAGPSTSRARSRDAAAASRLKGRRTNEAHQNTINLLFVFTVRLDSLKADQNAPTTFFH